MLRSKNNLMRGFTMIELVIVIVILGILAAMILPRFANLQTQARQSSMRGLEGALIAASAVAHAQLIATNSSATSVILEGQTVNMVHGYPAGTITDGIANAISSYAGYNATASGGVVNFVSNSSSTCYVTYTQSAAAGSAPVVAASGSCS